MASTTVLQELTYVYDDGGRQVAGFKGDTGDCVVRAIAIATGLSYREVYDELTKRNKVFAATSRSRAAKKIAKTGGTVRAGNIPQVYRPYLEELGWVWIPTMEIGKGTRIHLRAEDLPSGTLFCTLSRHVVVVKDLQLHDTYDASREGTRAVYGVFVQSSEADSARQFFADRIAVVDVEVAERNAAAAAQKALDDAEEADNAEVRRLLTQRDRGRLLIIDAEKRLAEFGVGV